MLLTRRMFLNNAALVGVGFATAFGLGRECVCGRADGAA